MGLVKMNVARILLLVGGLSSFNTPVAFAAEDYKIPEISWAMDAKTAAAKKSADQMAQIVSTCQNTNVTMEAVNQSTKAMQAIMSGQAKNIGKTCSENTVFHATMDCGSGGGVGESVNLTCDAYKGSGGNAALASELKRAETAACSATCNIGKLKAISKELNCVQNMIGTTRQALQSELQTGLSNSISTVTRISQNLNRSQEFVNGKLHGTKEGEKGWLALQKEAESSFASMQSEIATIRGLHQMSMNSRKELIDRTNVEIATQTETCMTAGAGDAAQGVKRLNLQCVKGGPQVSPQQWIKCQVEQGAKLSKGGRQDQLQAQSAEAQTLASQFDPILSSVLAAVKKGVSLKEIDATFTPALQQIDGQLSSRSGFSTRDALLRTLAGCKQSAENYVTRDAANNTTQIKKDLDSADVSDQQMEGQVNTLLNKYARFFSKSVSDLNGISFPLSVADCRKWTAATKLKACKTDLDCRAYIYNEQQKCLNNLEVASEAALRGTVDANVPLTFSTESKQIIPGAEAGFGIEVTCAGIDGCVRTYQNVSQNIDQRRTQIVVPANQQIEQYVGQMNTLLGTENGKIQAHVATLNEHLTAMGAGAKPFKIDPLELTELEKVGEGMDAIYKMPNPIVKKDKDGMTDALAETSNTMKTLSENEAKARSAMTKLQSLAVSCPKEGLDTLLQSLAQENSRLNSCDSIKDACEGASSENSMLSSVEDVLGRIQGLEHVALDHSAYGSLQNGYIVQCPGLAKLGQAERSIANSCLSASTNFDQILAKVEKKDKAIGAAASAISGGQ